MAEESPKVWWIRGPEYSAEVVWTHDFRDPERERLMRLAQAEMMRRRRRERGL
jgi:hypothetical protein